MLVEREQTLGKRGRVWVVVVVVGVAVAVVGDVVCNMV